MKIAVGLKCSHKRLNIHSTSDLRSYQLPSSTIIAANFINCYPVHFKNTRFFVDQFHWCRYVGCSSEYSPDHYPSPLISAINSQVSK